jgi:putative ABC transport system permease protein
LASSSNLTHHQSDKIFNTTEQNQSLNFSLLNRENGLVKAGSKVEDVDIINTNSKTLELLNLKVLYGQNFDDKSNQQNIIIGNNLAKQLFERPTEAIGKHVFMRDKEKVIVGILDDINSFKHEPLNNLNNLVLGILGSEDYVSDIILTTQPGISLNQQDFNKYFPELKDKFQITSLEISDGGKVQQKLIENLKYSTRYTAIVSLILSGFCVFTSIMLSSNQKIKEIGIRKTIGATNRQISMHFIYESLILGLIGGLIGCFITQSVLFIKINGVNLIGSYSVDIKTASISLLSCILISLIFGLIPSLQAGRKNPIECLKYSL